MLFNEEDLSKHFILLNQTKVNIEEIQQIWKAIKEITRLRAQVSSSALEIARRAGWDDNVSEIETRVITAIAALEDAGFLRRGQNNPRVYANSIQVKTVEEARNRIEQSPHFHQNDREKAVRIIQKLISSQKRAQAQGEDGESRVDYIADHLGMRQKDVVRLVGLLREANILGDARDLSGTLAQVEKALISKTSFKRALQSYFELERFILENLSEEAAICNFKELNENALKKGLKHTSVKKIKTLVNFWSIKNWLKQSILDISKQKARLKLQTGKDELNKKLEARQFVEDYFSKPYNEFLSIYFPGARRDEFNRTITPAKFAQLFATLSPRQLEIINDSQTKNIVVAAGPGSGKTRVLAHKLASLILMEGVKHEQLLMLTFSRAAVTEFKRRLLELIGNAANFIEIKTFHSYCFDLLGKVGSIENSETIIKEAVKSIKDGQVEKSRITKTVLVIDEAQDISESEFSLIRALQDANEGLRLIAIGDDDQNIFAFRKSSSEFMKCLIKEEASCKYDLLENYRSSKELVEFANNFAISLPDRMKNEPLQSMNPLPGSIKLINHKGSNIVR